MSKQMEAQLRQAKTARAALQDEVVRLKRELNETQAENGRLTEMMKVWKEPGVPAGWKPVPVIPTPAMLDAVAPAVWTSETRGAVEDEKRRQAAIEAAKPQRLLADGIFRAMLAAAPEPPCAAPVSDNAGCESETEENDQQDQMDGIEKACQRYTEMILDMYPDLTASRDDTSRWWRPSWSHVLWMLEQIPKLSPTKAHRWLGFVQGALVFRGLTTIDDEREATRGMFDEGPSKQEASHD